MTDLRRKTSADALAPHQPLTDYYDDETARHKWLRETFDSTAVDYDRVEALMAFGTGPRYRGQALKRAGLKPGMRVLDVGTGTGLTAIQAAAIAGGPALVTCVDPSPGMLAQARGVEGMHVREGRAESLPVADASFDFLSMGFALRHVSDLRVAFAEYFRALKPGGRVCILEITQPQGALARRGLKFYLRSVVPTMARVFGRTRAMPELMRYHWDSIEACVPPPQVMQALENTGFVDVSRHIELRIFSEYRATKP
ncbi:MAG TPA: class I SAM-dependent methyltransferase [Casimicrobiaceae bacterium]|nr:class I SAM-dependent methyltransferase [Casimicrobiaceae bacterium]